VAVLRKDAIAGAKFQRNTRQRQVILDELRGLTSHPTAADLYKIVRQRLPRISLGTVYRNLELLAQMNLVRKLKISGSEARYDGNPTPHSHVRCIRCDRVGDLEEVAYDPGRSFPREMGGYTVFGCLVEFFGLCPACRKKSERKGTR